MSQETTTLEQHPIRSALQAFLQEAHTRPSQEKEKRILQQLQGKNQPVHFDKEEEPLLRDLLKLHLSEDLRLAAFDRLSLLPSLQKETQESILHLLWDDAENLRLAVIAYIRGSRFPIQLVETALTANLQQDKPSIRARCAWAIGILQISNPETLNALREAIDDADGNVRRRVAGALIRLGRPAIAQIEISRWCELLNDNSPFTRAHAARALGILGESAQDALPALLQKRHDQEANVRTAIAEAFGKIAIPQAAVLEALETSLYDKDDAVRATAAKALGAFGESASHAVEALRRSLREGHKWVKIASAEALGLIGKAAQSALPDLATALQDDAWGVWMAAAEAIHQINPDAPEVCESIKQRISHQEAHERCAAADAIGRMGCHAEEMIACLHRALQDSNEWVRRDAAFAIGKLGEAAIQAVPLLIQILLHDDEWVQSAAFDALVQLGREHVEGALDDAIRHSPPSFRKKSTTAFALRILQQRWAGSELHQPLSLEEDTAFASGIFPALSSESQEV